MEALHVIDRLDIDISFEDPHQAQLEEPGLLEWVRDDLLVAVDDVLTRLAPAGSMRVIDRIELDLGEVDALDFRKELRERLRAELVRALGGVVTISEHKTDSDVTGLEAELREGLGDSSELAMVCAEMVASLVDRFLPGVGKEIVHEQAKRTLHRHVVLEGNDFHARSAAQALLEDFGRSHPRLDLRNLAMAIQRRLMQPPFAAAKPAAAAAQKPATVAASAGVPVSCAGLVVVAPYLPRLFALLGLASEGRFLDEAALARAVVLLRRVAMGGSECSEPPVLERILCGAPPDFDPGPVELSEREMEVVEQMLQGTIQHWSVLGRTSPDGLRETFLSRPGWIEAVDENWHLRVRKGTFDMLLDRLPWGMSMVKFPWMRSLVQVEWR